MFLAWASCHRSTNKNGSPEKLSFGYATGEDPTESLTYRQLIADYLEEEMGLKKVTIHVSTDYAAVIEALKTNKIQMAFLGEFSYVIAAKKANVEAIATYTTTDGSSIPTGSVIITHVNSGLKNMDDVKEKAKDLSLCFADPASTSGHMFPRLYLNELGLNPEESFKEVFFSNGHTPAIFTVLTQKSDLGCTFLNALHRLERKNKLDMDKIRILWKSEPYVHTPICVKKDLDEDFKKALQKAFVDLPKNNPELWNKYKEKAMLYYTEETRDKIVYKAAHDSMYDPIRKAAAEMQKLDLLKY